MNYRKDKYGNDISVLGFGCMRFTRKMGKIDTDKAESEIMLAIERGINYFDTAYIYPGSEELLGYVLEKNNARSRVKIASKLPHYLVKDLAGAQKIFKTELERLKTDHIDYYLIHMLTDTNALRRMTDMGVMSWLEEEKAKGTVGQIGFSYHGDTDEFIKLIDAREWDFAQVQYNYLDEHSQAGRRGVRYAAEKGLPIIVMEPLRGGALATGLPKGAADAFGAHPIKRSPAEWSFRWLWDQPEIMCVLSGMNSEAMIEENVKAASSAAAGELGQREREMFDRARQGIADITEVPCTGCGYCRPCPAGVDIPGVFSAMNSGKAKGRLSGARVYIMCTQFRKQASGASACVKCGACEKKCPQHIPIREKLQKAQRLYERHIFKLAGKAARAFFYR